MNYQIKRYNDLAVLRDYSILKKKHVNIYKKYGHLG